MNKIRNVLFVFLAVVSIGSCKRFDDLLNNPNAPTTKSADVDLYLNSVQLNFASFFNSAQDFGAQLSRMTSFTGPSYQNGFSPQSFDGVWTSAYTGVLKNANSMIPLAKQQSKYYHAGIAEVLKAYTLFTLVDMFGDVPYTEANQGNENLNPKTQSGREVYNAALALLDSAIADFGKTSASNPTVILFNNSSKASWIKVANTLKLRAYMNTRLVDNTVGAKIQALVTAGNIITTDADEFTFKYGTSQSTPNSRHPRYNAGYVASGGASGYIANQFLYSVRFEKSGVTDPRYRYYFYRQTSSTPTEQQQPCAYQNPPAHYPATMPFCYLGQGFWGRDHGDNSGIPPDGEQRTVWGVYPAGGKFDCNDFVKTTLNEGGRGAGIAPLWMASFTDFTLAEAALTVPGFTGDARALLQSAVTKSINRVLAFPGQVGATVCSAAVPTSTTITNYINYVMARYDAAADNNAKLDVVIKEYWLALWGNGLDAYNMYRRTGKPKLSINGGTGLQLTVVPNPGPFIRSFLYPSVYVNLNANASQKQNWATKVFWDTNTDPLQ